MIDYSHYGVGLWMRTDADRRISFERVCDEHRWSSLPAPTPEETTRCPHCAVRMTETVGAQRYLALRQRLAEMRRIA